MAQKQTLVISSADQLISGRTRREFLKVLGLGGAIVLLPSVVSACSDDNSFGPNGGSGSPLTIDFSKGDIAVLQFAYALEQLEADFYTKAVAAFNGSNLSANEQAILGDIKNHEVIHREFLKAALGTANDFTIKTTYNGVDFSSRTSVLGNAGQFENLGVAAYNGAAQYISSTDYLTLAGKIVSVEARHASAILDLISPSTSAFAPNPFDDAFSPTKVANGAQGFIVDKLTFANAPSTFVQGPNNNGV